MKNLERANHLIQNCYKWGTREFCLCPGARNAPLVIALEKLQCALEIKVNYFFDERSAAFFALGRTQSNNHQPVAVITTSGTAVAELYPSIIEAYYRQSPLVLITADRPPSYRQSGAPQSINQVGIFGDYAPTLDLGMNTENPSQLKNTVLHGPIHINISFDEPLLANEQTETYSNIRWSEARKQTAPQVAKEQAVTKKASKGLISVPFEKNELVILGGIPERYRSHLIKKLQEINRPIYAEALSGLRETPELHHLTLKSGGQSIERAYLRGDFNCILRLGSVPTLRFWRDLDTNYKNITVHSISHLPFSGLARGSSPVQSFEAFLNGEVTPKPLNKNQSSWLKWDKKKSGELEALYQAFPNSEASMVNLLSHQIATDEMIFLGNSLPIREWDLCSTFLTPHANIKANRGANGIDGIISSFFGAMHSTKK